ncbi:MAG TPA: DsbC family protein [Dissulfurispiraceae bacterium]|nr:DsbC family protein [Dissulfurispiraceae bacterium]
MRKMLCLLILAVMLFANQACALSEKDHDQKAHDCAKCHTLTNEEAAAVLKDIAPDLKILNVGQAPVKGLWEVFLQAGGRKAVVYVDYSKKNFFSGAIIDIKAKKNLTQEKFEELNKVDVSKIPLDDALVLGDKNAKYKVIVFSDPDCPFCGKLHQELKKVVEKRKDIAFFIKLFPLPMHPDAAWKAKTIICKKSLQLLEDNFEGKQIPKVDCDTKVIEENSKIAAESGISGTPALVLPDGRIAPGFREADALIELITKK